MKDGQLFPEKSLPLTERRHGNAGTAAIVSQQDLKHHSIIEQAVMNSRADIIAKVNDGAVIEPGGFDIDPSGMEKSMSPIVRRRDAAPPLEETALAASKAEEPEADGGLTYGEQAMLRNFAVRGEFQPAVLRAIAGRFAHLGAERFAAERARMWETGCYEIGSWLVRAAQFQTHVWRVRLAIGLYERGFTRYRGCILEGIYTLNRGYFAYRF